MWRGVAWLALTVSLGCGVAEIGQLPDNDRSTEAVEGDTAEHDSEVDAIDDIVADLPPPAVCGDAICDIAVEDASSCAVDCGGNAAAMCLRARCTESLAACLADPGCYETFECLLACADESCAQQCYVSGRADAGGTELLTLLLDCGQTTRCFLGCGDGTCVDGETGQTCPEDCGHECVISACPTQSAACSEVAGCEELLVCWSGCSTYACQVDCIRTAPATSIVAWKDAEACAQASGCVPDTSCGDGLCADDESETSCPEDCVPTSTCGDGVCEEDEDNSTCPSDCIITEPPTCEEKCGGYNAQWPCQCDLECDEYGDCCLDVQPICGMDFCGDGTCTGDEDVRSCPEECEAADLCGDALCGDSEDAATCPGDCPASCGDGLCTASEDVDSCEPDCGPLSCKDKCGAFTEGGACQCDGACVGRGDCCLDIFAQCGVSFCGDDACTDGEDAQSCASDCASVCGDDVCADDETVETCTVDCFGACAQSACSEPWSQCEADTACMGALTTCIAQCGEAPSCAEQCAAASPVDSPEPFDTLVACAVSAGCLP